MKEVLVTMIKIYQPKGIDWMGFHLTDNNPYTYHHIVEKRHGGQLIVSNGAILTRRAHDLLNALELFCPNAYNDYQNIFRRINASCQPISDDMWDEIYGMLLEIFYYKSYILKNKRMNIDEIGEKYLEKRKVLIDNSAC